MSDQASAFEDAEMMDAASNNMASTLIASLRSVGTAVTLASVGVYLHQRQFVSADGKRTLAVISQQVTFPLFLFTKIIFCNQDWSSDPCPNVASTLNDVWMLLFWPVVVVGLGLVVGWCVARATRAPEAHMRSVLAACAFGNSTGLPITLLTVVHSNFPATSDLGRIDPTLFLSVYLLLYPVLQWGLGGWLLAPASSSSSTSKSVRKKTITKSKPTSLGSTLRLNVLNLPQAQHTSNSKQGLSSMDEGLYISEVNLQSLSPVQRESKRPISTTYNSTMNANNNHTNDELVLDNPVDLSRHNSIDDVHAQGLLQLQEVPNEYDDETNDFYGQYPTEQQALLADEKHVQQHQPLGGAVLHKVSSTASITLAKAQSLGASLSVIAHKCLQPPVIGALLGIGVAVTPLRGIFVDLVDRSADAPLEFLFDGLYNVGLSAVPINMMILGCNLSASLTAMYEARQALVMRDRNSPSTTVNTSNDKSAGGLQALLPPNHMSMETVLGIVLGKLVLLPLIGIALAVFLKQYVLDIPDEIDGSFYVVLMIVFLTPTANNVMVMVELSGSETKESIATVIALQYLVAPIILSGTMTIAIGIASDWS